MEIDEAKRIIEPWFSMSEIDVLQRFASLPNAVVVQLKDTSDYTSVFIPGTRPDRVLLVSHADTVWQDTPELKVLFDDGIFYSGTRFRGLSKHKHPVLGGYGIGADDRAGCALIWEMRNLGHSIIITNGEECGCLGAALVATKKKRLNALQEHSFAVEFDRNGFNDLCTYSVGSEEFDDYCEKQTGYRQVNGTFTDICILCESMCGVNMSIGYKNEHTPNEILNLNWWCNTFNIAHKWLSSNNLPKFRH